MLPRFNKLPGKLRLWLKFGTKTADATRNLEKLSMTIGVVTTECCVQATLRPEHQTRSNRRDPPGQASSLKQAKVCRRGAPVPLVDPQVRLLTEQARREPA